ncbi:MAG: hypothetical protein A2Z14_06485 [Chloroflexi bacterium RBG_16_48_8]|nr:MAG: hypothetical protein A2Z14_06485 [Chloroflexi bacterium RBG_16_48_8]
MTCNLQSEFQGRVNPPVILPVGYVQPKRGRASQERISTLFERYRARAAEFADFIVADKDQPL